MSFTMFVFIDNVQEHNQYSVKRQFDMLIT